AGGRGGLAWGGMGSGGVITQSLHTFCAEPLDPFGHRFRCRVELVSRIGLVQPALNHPSHHRLSTFGRQRRILVDVHLVSPWNTEASQPQLPRFRPDGQPPERSKLANGAALRADPLGNPPYNIRTTTQIRRQTGQGEHDMSFYERGPVRIRYEEAGSGFPLMVIAGGGLNSTIAGLDSAISPYNPINEFKNEY